MKVIHSLHVLTVHNTNGKVLLLWYPPGKFTVTYMLHYGEEVLGVQTWCTERGQDPIYFSVCRFTLAIIIFFTYFTSRGRFSRLQVNLQKIREILILFKVPNWDSKVVWFTSFTLVQIRFCCLTAIFNFSKT